MFINGVYDGSPHQGETMENTPNMKETIAVRIILPSGVKEIVGPRDWVAEETVRLIKLEADIGESFVEEIPAASESPRTIRFGGSRDNA